MTIFPGSKTSQSDVESFHNLVQTESYEVENLSRDRLLLGRGRTYQGYFNHVRKNLWKGGKTPAMVLAEAGGRVNPEALTFPPIRLQTIPLGPPTPSQGGNHVPDLVSFPWLTRGCEFAMVEEEGSERQGLRNRIEDTQSCSSSASASTALSASGM